jgi:hypothetical protein
MTAKQLKALASGISSVLLVLCFEAAGSLIAGTTGQLVGFLIALPLCFIVGMWIGFH